MRTCLYLAAIAALLAFAYAFAVVGYQACYIPPRVGQGLAARADALQGTVAAARQDLARTERDLVAEVAKVTAAVAMLERNSRPVLDAVEWDLNVFPGVAAEATATLRKGQEAMVELGRIRGDLRPVLASTDELLAQTSGTVAVVRPQLLGLAAAGKMAFGSTADAARQVDRALPEFLAIGRQFGKASTATATNVERITRPDRWWITGAKIAAPAVGGFAWSAFKGK